MNGQTQQNFDVINNGMQVSNNFACLFYNTKIDTKILIFKTIVYFGIIPFT